MFRILGFVLLDPNCYSARTEQGELGQIKQKTMTTEIYFAWESKFPLNYKSLDRDQWPFKCLGGWGRVGRGVTPKFTPF